MCDAQAPTRGVPFLDRDHSILAFNERVLNWAHRADVPLLERLRYLTIVSSNLDEFFEVRAAPHLTAAAAGEPKGLYSVRSLQELSAAARKIVAFQYALFNDELMPAFAKEGIEIVSHGDRNAAQRAWVHEYFEREVRPLLIPVGLDPAHPFPQVANKSLNFIVRLAGKDAFGRENEIAIVKVPRVLPRLIRMPARVSGGKTLLVLLSSVIRAHLDILFPGREVGQFSQFRVTRHSDLAVDEEDVRNLRTSLRLGSAGDAEHLYLSSADWMNRNMLRRVEVAWPILDPVLRQRIVDECLVASLHDARDAWDLQPDGHYKRVKGADDPLAHGAQAALMQRYGANAAQE